MKRTPLKRKTPLVVRAGLRRKSPLRSGDAPLHRTPIKAVSQKRQRQMRLYMSLRATFLEAHPRCQFPGECVQPATDVHHRKGRIGDLYLDVSHWSALCRPHHAWVTEHPVAAIDMGISERRIGGDA